MHETDMATNKGNRYGPRYANHAAFCKAFPQPLSKPARSEYRQEMRKRFESWAEMTGMAWAASGVESDRVDDPCVHCEVHPQQVDNPRVSCADSFGPKPVAAPYLKGVKAAPVFFVMLVG